jgi:hypothetical protein
MNDNNRFFLGTSLLPKLDACGGHFGTTPDSEGAKKYHYHVQTAAPFTIGCFGPAKNEAGAETLVTLVSYYSFLIFVIRI